MEYVLFLKPLADMVYQFPVLDYLLLGICVVALFFVAKRIGNLLIVDVLAVVFLALLSVSLLRAFSGVYDYLKLVSAYLLYFLGRGCYGRRQRINRAIIYSHFIVILVNLGCLAVGYGFVTWGSAYTFRGMYYFKMDLALAMVYCIAVILFFTRMNFWPKLFLLAAAGGMLILTNSRISILLAIMVAVLYAVYVREKKQKLKRIFKVRLKMVLVILLVMVLSIFAVQKLAALPALRRYNFLSFTFNSISDFGNVSNTQGRINIWSGILAKFARARFYQRMIGIDLVGATWKGWETHNTYLRVLYATGYVGLLLFLSFFVALVRRFNRVKNRNLFFFTLSLMLCFLIQGMTATTIIFTQMTWIAFFYAGMCVTASVRERGVNYYSEKVALNKLRFRLVAHNEKKQGGKRT